VDRGCGGPQEKSHLDETAFLSPINQIFDNLKP
jgi:hypothetical protein